MTPSTQNLNHRLSLTASAAPAPRRNVGINWKATAIHSSSPPVRIVGARSRYQGGYRVNV
jgi:hypothetical protein